MSDKYLFLQCRNLGDAIISTGLINSLGKSFPEVSVDIFAKSSFRPIFENNPYITHVFYANFPMGAPKGLNVKNSWALISQICKLRKKNYSVCLNREGDFRENLIGRLVNPKKNISVLWCENHVYNNMIRKGFLNLVDQAVNVPEEVVNVYSANDYIARKLGCMHLVPSKIFLNKELTKNFSLSDKNIIAVHPGASKKSKLWHFDNWKKLIRKLILQGFNVWIFGAPNQKMQMQTIFREVIDNKRVLLHASNLDELFIKLSSVKLLIGLDSFSVHAAYALGVPVVMLNGANDYRLFAPPGATVIAKKTVCPYYPCYNKPKCIGSKFEIICMKSIKVDDVMATVERLQSCP